MSDSLYAIGVNHLSAPVAMRERLSFAPEALTRALDTLVHSPAAGVREAAILSTCNRTEIYCQAVQPAAILDWFAAYHQLDAAQLSGHVYTLAQESAVRHAFRVAAGLDSMVLGEPQILGQMKEAVRSAQAAGTLGSTLNKLFQQSFSVAKEVRSTTAIGANVVSMAAAAVKLSQRLFPSLVDQQVLFIGAGEMIELCATHFAAQQPRSITVANRTLERAQLLAGRFQAQSMLLRDLPQRLQEFDVIVSCTASSLPILGKGTVESALRARRRRPMFMVDLAVPRDIEPEIAAMEDVYLYDIDDLAGLVRDGKDARQSAVTEAEAIIEARTDGFLEWLRARENVPLIRQLREHADGQRQQELARALNQLQQGQTPEAVLEALSRSLTNKLLHPPLEALSQLGAQEAGLLSRIYRIETQSNKDTDEL